MSKPLNQNNDQDLHETVKQINQLIKTHGLCVWDPNMGRLRSCYEIEGAIQSGGSIYINLANTKQFQ